MTDNYETDVRGMTVERCMSETNYEHEVGEIMSVSVEVTRREVGGGNGSVRRNRTVKYDVDDGVARVRSVEPTYPKSDSSTERVETKHLAPIMAAADGALPGAVPEVECVRPLNATLRNQRAKHEDPAPEGTTESFDSERARADGGSQ